MSSAPTEAEPNPAFAQDQDTQFFRDILRDLIERGADLAKRLHEQAITPTPGSDTPAPITPATIAAFDQIARAVRRTVVLARHIAQPPPPRDTNAPHRAAARKRIIREVEDAIQRECEGKVAKALDDELLERLDSPDLDDEIKHRSTKDIIADICRDLGIAHIEGTHPWKRRTPGDIALLFARAAERRPQPSNPLTIPPGHPNPMPIRRALE